MNTLIVLKFKNLHVGVILLQFGMMETIVVGVTDRFPDTIGKHRIKFVCVCCVVGFLLGLPLTTKVRIRVKNCLKLLMFDCQCKHFCKNILEYFLDLRRVE